MNLKKNSDFFERLLQIAEYKGFSSLNTFALNGLGYASSEKLNRLKDGNNKPSVNIICDISNKFEDIDLNWLLTGRGSMLLNKLEASDDTPSSQQRTIENMSDTINRQAKIIEILTLK